MKLLSHIFATAAIVSTGALLSCSTGTSGFSYQNVSATITPALTFVLTSPGTFTNPSVVEFTANVANAPAMATWTLLPTANFINIPSTPSSSGVVAQTTGTLANQTGNTVFYTAPSSPPVYSGNALVQANALGIPQGSVMLMATVPSDPNNPSATVTAKMIFQVPVNVATPTAGLAYYVTCGLNPNSPPVVSVPVVNPANVYDVVPRGTTFQFQGFCVGNFDTGVIYSVNGVVGGAAATGTITAGGLYTAPATPPTGTVTVTATSHAVSTATASAIVTVQ